MRFLNDIYQIRTMNPDETALVNSIKEQGSVRKYLQSISLSKLCQDIIIYGICMSSQDDMEDAAEALKRLQKYAISLGKYGTSPFVYCHYGFSDVAQGFSRSSSIAGGVFLCGHSFNAIRHDDDTWKIDCTSPEGRSEGVKFTVSAQKLVKNAFYAPEAATFKGVQVDYVQYFTDKELPYERRGYITLPGIASNSVQCLFSRIDNISLVALSVIHVDGEEEALNKALEIICGKEYKEQALYMVSYSLYLRQWDAVKTVEDVMITSDGTIGINSDIDSVISEAQSVCGDQLFRDDEIVEVVPDEPAHSTQPETENKIEN